MEWSIARRMDLDEEPYYSACLGRSSRLGVAYQRAPGGRRHMEHTQYVHAVGKGRSTECAYRQNSCWSNE